MYVLYRILVTKSFYVLSLPLGCPDLCERDFVIFVAKCGTFCFVSLLLHLSNDPDIAIEHTYCIVGLAVLFSSSRRLNSSPAPLLHHCACELLYRKDYTACLQTVGVWSLSPEQEGDEEEDAVLYFLLPLVLLSWALAAFKGPMSGVWHCHRRKGGSRGLMYQPVVKLSQM